MPLITSNLCNKLSKETAYQTFAEKIKTSRSTIFVDRDATNTLIIEENRLRNALRMNPTTLPIRGWD